MARTREPAATPSIEEPSSDALGDTFVLLRSLWALVHALDIRSKWMSSHLGVTGPQRTAIRVVGRTPGITAGNLAKQLHLHPSTLTGILQRLEERGYVARAKDTSDSRRSMFVLTRNGRTVDAARDGTIELCVERVVARHDPEVIATVRAFVEDLAAELTRGTD